MPVMANKIVQKTFNVLDYNYLEELIKEHINPEFNSIIAEFEWNNGSCYKATGIKIDHTSRDYNSMKATTATYLNLYSALSYLANIKVIPEGDYLIEVSW